MMRQSFFRVGADVFLLFAALFLPWWVVALSAIIFFFFFRRFYELLCAAFLIDIWYSAKGAAPYGFEFAFSFCAALLFFALSFVKERMRFSRRV